MASYLTAGFSVACFAQSQKNLGFAGGSSKILSCLVLVGTLWIFIHPCELLYIFSKVFCSEIATLVYHWRNISPRAWTVIHPW